MQVNIILNKTNFHQIDEDFDVNRDYISKNELIHSFDIIDLTYEEIENLRPKIYEMLWSPFPRNGIEYAQDNGVESINIMVIDYPLDKDWESDQKVLEAIDNIDSFFEVNKVSSKGKATPIDADSFSKIIEVERSGEFDIEAIATMHDILNKYDIEYSVMYLNTYERNTGFTDGGLKAVFKVIGDSANTITVIDFFKKIFHYDSDAVEVHDPEDVEQEISEYYKIHASQLDLESMDYNEENDHISYVFSSREYTYYIKYKNGTLIKTNREKRN